MDSPLRVPRDAEVAEALPPPHAAARSRTSLKRSPPARLSLALTSGKQLQRRQAPIQDTSLHSETPCLGDSMRATTDLTHACSRGGYLQPTDGLHCLDHSAAPAADPRREAWRGDFADEGGDVREDDPRERETTESTETPDAAELLLELVAKEQEILALQQENEQLREDLDDAVRDGEADIGQLRAQFVLRLKQQEEAAEAAAAHLARELDAARLAAVEAEQGREALQQEMIRAESALSDLIQQLSDAEKAEARLTNEIADLHCQKSEVEAALRQQVEVAQKDAAALRAEKEIAEQEAQRLVEAQSRMANELRRVQYMKEDAEARLIRQLEVYQLEAERVRSEQVEKQEQLQLREREGETLWNRERESLLKDRGEEEERFRHMLKATAEELDEFKRREQSHRHELLLWEEKEARLSREIAVLCEDRHACEQELNTQLEAARHAAATLERETQLLKETLLEQEKVERGLVGDVARLQKELMEKALQLETQVAALTAEQQRLCAEKAETEERLARHSAAEERMQRELERCKKLHSETQTSLQERLEAAQAAADTMREQMTTRQREADEALANASKQLGLQIEAVMQAKAKSEVHARECVQRLEAQIASLEEQCQRSELELRRRDDMERRLRQEVEDLAQEKAVAAEQLRERVAALDAQCNQLRREVERAATDARHREVTEATLNRELIDLQARHAADRQEMQQRIRSQEKELEDLRQVELHSRGACGRRTLVSERPSALADPPPCVGVEATDPQEPQHPDSAFTAASAQEKADKNAAAGASTAEAQRDGECGSARQFHPACCSTPRLVRSMRAARANCLEAHPQATGVSRCYSETFESDLRDRSPFWRSLAASDTLRRASCEFLERELARLSEASARVRVALEETQHKRKGDEQRLECLLRELEEGRNCSAEPPISQCGSGRGATLRTPSSCVGKEAEVPRPSAAVSVSAEERDDRVSFQDLKQLLVSEIGYTDAHGGVIRAAYHTLKWLLHAAKAERTLTGVEPRASQGDSAPKGQSGLGLYCRQIQPRESGECERAVSEKGPLQRMWPPPQNTGRSGEFRGADATVSYSQESTTSSSDLRGGDDRRSLGVGGRTRENLSDCPEASGSHEVKSYAESDSAERIGRRQVFPVASHPKSVSDVGQGKDQAREAQQEEGCNESAPVERTAGPQQLSTAACSLRPVTHSEEVGPKSVDERAAAAAARWSRLPGSEAPESSGLPGGPEGWSQGSDVAGGRTTPEVLKSPCATQFFSIADEGMDTAALQKLLLEREDEVSALEDALEQSQRREATLASRLEEAERLLETLHRCVVAAESRCDGVAAEMLTTLLSGQLHEDSSVGQTPHRALPEEEGGKEGKGEGLPQERDHRCGDGWEVEPLTVASLGSGEGVLRDAADVLRRSCEKERSAAEVSEAPQECAAAVAERGDEDESDREVGAVALPRLRALPLPKDSSNPEGRSTDCAAPQDAGCFLCGLVAAHEGDLTWLPLVRYEWTKRWMSDPQTSRHLQSQSVPFWQDTGDASGVPRDDGPDRVRPVLSGEARNYPPVGHIPDQEKELLLVVPGARRHLTLCEVSPEINTPGAAAKADLRQLASRDFRFEPLAQTALECVRLRPIRVDSLNNETCCAASDSQTESSRFVDEGWLASRAGAMLYRFEVAISNSGGGEIQTPSFLSVVMGGEPDCGSHANGPTADASGHQGRQDRKIFPLQLTCDVDGSSFMSLFRLYYECAAREPAESPRAVEGSRGHTIQENRVYVQHVGTNLFLAVSGVPLLDLECDNILSSAVCHARAANAFSFASSALRVNAGKHVNRGNDVDTALTHLYEFRIFGTERLVDATPFLLLTPAKVAERQAVLDAVAQGGSLWLQLNESSPPFTSLPSRFSRLFSSGFLKNRCLGLTGRGALRDCAEGECAVKTDTEDERDEWIHVTDGLRGDTQRHGKAECGDEALWSLWIKVGGLRRRERVVRRSCGRHHMLWVGAVTDIRFHVSYMKRSGTTVPRFKHDPH
ncbi:hypothetical protein BESB_025300 [Besnoitia besnoiti]|uniref:Uncharacterized protein n=1 Tax=Besnoitia besnoiti TaxID=94643 RepID=A0A2A9M2X1_BESBE|nr:uncharacterized protein BESB_025300 [Besnoitia besnoiti]PFH31564.1 hypothetical protein BESB_025300 [Besnoitia besnoiti]